MKLTLAQIRQIYNSYDLELTDKELILDMDQCNEQDGINGRNPEQWAHFFARQESTSQKAYFAELAQFHRDAYGE